MLETYVGDVDKNHIVILLQIHSVLRANSIGHGLNHNISIELCISSHGRPNCVLDLTDQRRSKYISPH